MNLLQKDNHLDCLLQQYEESRNEILVSNKNNQSQPEKQYGIKLLDNKYKEQINQQEHIQNSGKQKKTKKNNKHKSLEQLKQIILEKNKYLKKYQLEKKQYETDEKLIFPEITHQGKLKIDLNIKQNKIKQIQKHDQQNIIIKNQEEKQEEDQQSVSSDDSLINTIDDIIKKGAKKLAKYQKKQAQNQKFSNLSNLDEQMSAINQIDENYQQEQENKNSNQNNEDKQENDLNINNSYINNEEENVKFITQFYDQEEIVSPKQINQEREQDVKQINSKKKKKKKSKKNLNQTSDQENNAQKYDKFYDSKRIKRDLLDTKNNFSLEDNSFNNIFFEQSISDTSETQNKIKSNQKKNYSSKKLLIDQHKSSKKLIHEKSIPIIHLNVNQSFLPLISKSNSNIQLKQQLLQPSLLREEIPDSIIKTENQINQRKERSITQPQALKPAIVTLIKIKSPFLPSKSELNYLYSISKQGGKLQSSYSQNRKVSSSFINTSNTQIEDTDCQRSQSQQVLSSKQYYQKITGLNNSVKQVSEIVSNGMRGVINVIQMQKNKQIYSDRNHSQSNLSDISILKSNDQINQFSSQSIKSILHKQKIQQEKSYERDSQKSFDAPNQINRVIYYKQQQQQQEKLEKQQFKEQNKIEKQEKKQQIEEQDQQKQQLIKQKKEQKQEIKLKAINHIYNQTKKIVHRQAQKKNKNQQINNNSEIF